MINLKNVITKKLLISDSNELNIFQKEHKLNLNYSEFTFTFNQLVSFEDFSGRLSKKNLENIIDTLKISKNKFGYTSSDKLDLYVLDSNGFLIIFAIGEYQPSLYKIYLEGAFSKQ